MLRKNLTALISMFIFFGFVSIGITIAGSPCPGDLDHDGDCDGSDLAVFASGFGRTDCPPSGPAPVEKTGQTTSDVIGDDGNLQKGIAWPDPRFRDNSNGTVTDNLTGLIWLKNANCFGLNGEKRWYDALTECKNLKDGSCGLSDGSSPGDWRLPNVKELQSLVHYGFYAPALPNTAGTGQWTEGDPFLGVYSSNYWSSTNAVMSPGYSWTVDFYSDRVARYNKSSYYSVWCVRGRQ